jgi:hypothetical protein
MKPYLAGAIIIFVGILLFWASTRRTLSQHARVFLEGQASIAIPAGLAALGVSAWRHSNDGNGRAGRPAKPQRKEPPA